MSNNGKVFANKINKNIRNNESVYYSNLSETTNSIDPKEKRNTKNIYQKINDIFNSRNYIYKADVIITTSSGEFKKRIIGRNSQYLITSENELIPIVEIKDIKYQ